MDEGGVLLKLHLLTVLLPTSSEAGRVLGHAHALHALCKESFLFSLVLQQSGTKKLEFPFFPIHFGGF